MELAGLSVAGHVQVLTDPTEGRRPALARVMAASRGFRLSSPSRQLIPAPIGGLIALPRNQP
jgi:hypothetical protein